VSIIKYFLYDLLYRIGEFKYKYNFKRIKHIKANDNSTLALKRRLNNIKRLSKCEKHISFMQKYNQKSKELLNKWQNSKK
jgi:hypothetical protein